MKECPVKKQYQGLCWNLRYVPEFKGGFGVSLHMALLRIAPPAFIRPLDPFDYGIRFRVLGFGGFRVLGFRV